MRNVVSDYLLSCSACRVNDIFPSMVDDLLGAAMMVKEDIETDPGNMFLRHETASKILLAVKRFSDADEGIYDERDL